VEHATLVVSLKGAQHFFIMPSDPKGSVDMIYIWWRCAQIRHRTIFKAKSGVILSEMDEF